MLGMAATCCVLLSKLYLCRRIYSNHYQWCVAYQVVYCFQNCIFVGEFTANQLISIPAQGLCIAFKIVSLQENLQPCGTNTWPTLRCVLLSKLYLCRRIYSEIGGDPKVLVLCIAFKIVSLQENLQPLPRRQPSPSGCVLLSKLYLCRRIYSIKSHFLEQIFVVYCFQNCIFVGEFTASPNFRDRQAWLCIAFKIVSLQENLQQRSAFRLPPTCCVLLSKLYLCRRIYSCFILHHIARMLCIAFKIVSLQENLQLQPKRYHKGYCCVLLSKLYLCRRIYSFP